LQSITFLIFLLIFAGYTIITIAGSRHKLLLMKIDIKQLFLIGIILFAHPLSMAQVRLPQLVSDGMVLQRDTKINIWGWASPGEKINIKFHHKDYKTITLTNGKWSVLIDAMKSGGPYIMDISASNHIIIRNILVGDVWFCSGQSNMVLPIERVKEKYPQEIAKANYPEIRNFFIPTISNVSVVAEDLPKSKWIACDSNTVLQFGAASYFFAKKLFEKYHIPIGIINSSVGGTPIQAWVSANGFNDLPAYHNRVIQLQDTAYLHQLQQQPKVNYAEVNKQINLRDKGLNGGKAWFDTTYKVLHWHHFWLPGYWADQGVKGLNGIVWFRKEINLPASMAGKPAKLFMGRIVDADDAYINGVLVDSTTYQYPPRRYALPAGLLKAGKNFIVIKISNTAGKGGFVPDKPYFISVGKDTIDLRGDWQYQVGEVFESPKNPSGHEPLVAQNEPVGLYNTMVAPVIPYKIKGIIWYQGESNTDKPNDYKKLLPALITDWRKKWNEGNIPFIYVQLPNFMEVQYSPSESHWAELRQAQLQALSMPNTAMTVNIGLGEWNDIHPLDKKDVGDRLALAAEHLAYGDTAIVSSGPIYKSAKIDDNKIIISFTGVGHGLKINNEDVLAQFSIAGADKKYVWAQAIIKNNQVIVWSDAVSHPLYVRYAWADNPEGANLYNIDGLPASPFSTDADQ